MMRIPSSVSWRSGNVLGNEFVVSYVLWTAALIIAVSVDLYGLVGSIEGLVSARLQHG